jgi:hypothetical protein
MDFKRARLSDMMIQVEQLYNNYGSAMTLDGLSLTFGSHQVNLGQNGSFLPAKSMPDKLIT